MWRSKLFRLLRFAALLYVGLALFVTVLQDKLIYFPYRASEAVLTEQARVNRLQPWRDETGRIIGWKSARADAPSASRRLVVFHGNMGYAQHRAGYIEGFERLADGHVWEVYLFEYPGYGAREGSLGEESFTAAGLAALKALRDADPRPIFLLGESIGGGLACALAGREPEAVAGVVLLTPFASLTEVAAHHYPYLPMRWLLRDRWDNAAALKNYRGPLAVRLAGEDEIVPQVQGRRLFENFDGRKQLWIEPGAHHNDLDFTPSHTWWEEVTRFLGPP